MYREGALSPPPYFHCMNQEGNSFSFGTLRLLNIFTTQQRHTR